MCAIKESANRKATIIPARKYIYRNLCLWTIAYEINKEKEILVEARQDEGRKNVLGVILKRNKSENLTLQRKN